MQEDPFVIRKYVLLVLRPELFLPEDRPLLINTDRTLRVPGSNHIPVTQESSWIPYCLAPDEPFLKDPNGQSLSEFDIVSLRKQSDLPSVFSLLVNANSKLEAVEHKATHPILQTHIQATKMAVNAIFHVPEVQHKFPFRTSPASPPAHRPGVLTSCLPAEPSGGQPPETGAEFCTDPPAESNGDTDNPQVQLPVDFEYQRVGDPSDPVINFEESGGDSEGDGPDTVNGLTFSQMEAVMSRVSDGTISGEERADAAMLMLGMAGDQLRFPPSPSFSDLGR